MEYRTGKQNLSPKQDQNQQPAEEYKQGEPSFGSPNSHMLSEQILSPGTPNSIMREMLDPRLSSAEEEADRLPAPDTVGPGPVRCGLRPQLFLYRSGASPPNPACLMAHISTFSH